MGSAFPCTLTGKKNPQPEDIPQAYFLVNERMFFILWQHISHRFCPFSFQSCLQVVLKCLKARHAQIWYRALRSIFILSSWKFRKQSDPISRGTVTQPRPEQGAALHLRLGHYTPYTAVWLHITQCSHWGPVKVFDEWILGIFLSNRLPDDSIMNSQAAYR